MKIFQKTFRHLSSNWVPILGIFICLAFFWKFFLQGLIPFPGDFVTGVYFPWIDYKWGYEVGVPVKNPIMADVASFSFPMRILAIDMLKSGEVPLWNPFILNGTPLLANFQSAPFSPTNIFYFLFDNLTAWSMQVISQHVFVCLTTFILLRHWGVSKIGSLIGGLAYAFGGFNLIWSQWNAHTLVASFIPLILYFTDLLILKKKHVYGILLSIVLSLQIFSGYPQLVLYTLLCLGVLLLIRGVTLKRFFWLGVFVALGIGLASMQILPGLELLKLSQRTIESHPVNWAFLPWEKIITFIAPDFFGNHATYNYWGPQDYTSNTGFVGVAAMAIAFVGAKLKKSETTFAIVIISLSLLLSFPTPLSLFLYKSGFAGLNAAAAHRALVLFNLGVALLAGFGFDALGKTKVNLKLSAISFIALLLSIFGLYALTVNQSVGLRNLILPSSVLGLTAILFFYAPKIKWILMPLMILELFYFGWKYTPFTPRHLAYPQTPVTNFLQDQKKPFRTTGNRVIPINFRQAYGVETVEGYDAVYPAASSEFIQQVNGGGEFRRYAIVDNDTSPLLDLANTKYFLALSTDENLDRFDSERFDLVFNDKSVNIYESKLAKPRAFIKESIPNSVTFLNYENQSSRLEVTLTDKATLLVSDTYYPGWKVFIDGAEGQILKSEYNFREIKLTPQRHIIEFVYSPDSFKYGLILSSASLAVLLVVFLARKKLEHIIKDND